MKTILFRPFGAFLLAAAAVPVVLAACGGNSSAAAPTSAATAAVAPAPPPSATPTATAQAPTATATIAPTAVATAAATAAPTAVATSAPRPTVPAGGGLSDKLAQGKLIFEKTAGGVGCAFCHNIDGKGNGPANVNAPNIRGKTEADIRAAVAGGVPMMAIVKLTDAEYEAVASYLDHLSTLP